MTRHSVLSHCCHSHCCRTFKIRSYGLDGALHRWLTSYLTNQNLQVVFGCSTSQPFPIAAGVLQGSILVPTLFLLYVNDAVYVLPDGVSPATYSNDTTLHSTMSSMETATASCLTFQTGVNKLAQWGALREFSLSCLNLRQWPFPDTALTGRSFPVAFNGLNVARMEKTKLLGVTFDRHLHHGHICEPLRFALHGGYPSFALRSGDGPGTSEKKMALEGYLARASSSCDRLAYFLPLE